MTDVSRGRAAAESAEALAGPLAPGDCSAADEASRSDRQALAMLLSLAAAQAAWYPPARGRG
jgi:hypothetical protein